MFKAGFRLNLYQQGLLEIDSLNTLTESQLEAALSFANKVASITVTRKGANPPWLHQIN